MQENEGNETKARFHTYRVAVEYCQTLITKRRSIAHEFVIAIIQRPVYTQNLNQTLLNVISPEGAAYYLDCALHASRQSERD